MKFHILLILTLLNFYFTYCFLDFDNEFYEVCGDYQTLTNYENLLWPSQNQPKPWLIFSSAKIYYSKCFNDKFNYYFSKIIPGSNNITFISFLQNLSLRNCLYYTHGGFVRDLINGVYPHDLDGQYSCRKEVLLEACGEILGPEFCYVDMNTSYFFIGNHSLEGYSWNSSFFSLIDQEYTPDSLYYDHLNQVILDLTGNGLDDIKKTKIRIPVQRNQWDLWLLKNIDDPVRKVFALRKVPRYWKLKEIGFQDYDNVTLNYLTDKIANLWENTKFPMKLAFLLHFCWILDGNFDIKSEFCTPKQQNFTNENVQKLKIFVKVLRADLPRKIIKDLDKHIKEIGCFLLKNSINILKFIVLIIFLFLIK